MADDNRRRNRMPILCVICRRRKVKCDRVRPVCGGCSKNGVLHLCRYIDPPWAKGLAAEPGVSEDMAEDHESELMALRDKVLVLENTLRMREVLLAPPLLPPPPGAAGPDSEPLQLFATLNTLTVQPSGRFIKLGLLLHHAFIRLDPYLKRLYFKINNFKRLYTNFQQHQENQHRVEIALHQQAMLNPFKMPLGEFEAVYEEYDFLHQENEIDFTTLGESKPEPKMEPLPLEPVPLPRRKRNGNAPTADFIDLNSNLNVAVPHASFDGFFGHATVPETPMGSTLAPPMGSALEAPGAISPLPIAYNQPIAAPALTGLPVSLLPPPPPPPASAPPLSFIKGSKRQKKHLNVLTNSTNDISHLAYPEMLQLVQRLLPPCRVVWLLVHTFLRRHHTHAPFVDDRLLLQATVDTVGPNDGGAEFILTAQPEGMARSQQMIAISTVLLVVRIAWLGLPINLPGFVWSQIAGNAEEELLARPEHVVPVLVVEYAQHFLSQLLSVNVFEEGSHDGVSTLEFIQCALLYKSYLMLSPESHDDDNYARQCVSENDRFFGSVVGTARRMGLYRDPLNFVAMGLRLEHNANTLTFRKRHWWRKLWWLMLNLDVYELLMTGCPIALNNDGWYDTQLPSSQELLPITHQPVAGGTDQLQLHFPHEDDYARELAAINNYRDLVPVMALLRRGTNMMYTAGRRPCQQEFNQWLSEMEAVIGPPSLAAAAVLQEPVFYTPGTVLPIHTLLSNVDYANGADNTTQIHHLWLHILGRHFVYVVHYVLFLHYERSQHIPHHKHMFRTHLQQAVVNGLDNYHTFMRFADTHGAVLGPRARIAEVWLLRPMLNTVNRLVQLMVLLVLRHKTNKHMLEPVGGSDGDPLELHERLLEYMQLFMDRADHFKNSYYMAWRVLTLVRFFVNTIKNFDDLNAALDRQMGGRGRAAATPADEEQRMPVYPPLPTTPREAMFGDLLHDNQQYGSPVITPGSTTIPDALLEVTDFDHFVTGVGDMADIAYLADMLDLM